MAVIEISNSRYNGTSSILSIIILISFVYFSIIIGAKLNRKLNPMAGYDKPDFMNAPIQNTMIAIQYYMKAFVKTQYKKKVASYETQLDDMTTKLQSSQKYMDMVSVAVGSLNQTFYANFTKNLSNFQNFLTGAQKVVKKIKDLSNQNIKNFENAYVQFQQRLMKYVDNLVQMLEIVNSHITTASVIPSLQSIMPTLWQVYNAIYFTIVNNEDFINTIYKGGFVLDKGKMEQAKMTAKPTTTTFRASGAILQNSGYK